ncbi:hypothetical protein ABBQ32_009606 [Trebouxia sp. C0010 RCD-2024]
MAGQDPFYLVKDDIQTSLNKAQDAFIAWQNAGKGSSERRRLQPEIEEECKSIAWQVEGMSTSIETAKQIASKAMQSNTTPGGKLSSAMQQDNERYIGTETQQQQMIMRRQDEDLDQLGNHVQRIGHMGLQIHDELQGQNVLLEQLDEDVEGTTSRLAAAQKKINTVLQKAGLKGQLMIIGVLIVLLVVLIMIAFS